MINSEKANDRLVNVNQLKNCLFFSLNDNLILNRKINKEKTNK